MTEEERLAKEKADAARADAEPEWAKKLSAKCDAVMTRMDSMPSLVKADTETAEMAADKKRADEEKERADKARADAEEKERADKARADAEEKERADKARADEEKAKADAAKADAEKEEEARADAVRKQVADAVAAATAPLQSQLAALTGAVPIWHESVRPPLPLPQVRCVRWSRRIVPDAKSPSSSVTRVCGWTSSALPPN
jgi:cell division protein FtsN